MRVRTRPHLQHVFADDPVAQWEEDLFAVFNGLAEWARVGRIPCLLAKALGSSTTVVRLSKTNAKKIRTKHREIKFADLLELATVFQRGIAARDSRSDLAFWFQSPLDPQKTIKAVVKTTRQRNELWLKTMHPIARRRLKALRAKAFILRDVEL